MTTSGLFLRFTGFSGNPRRRRPGCRRGGLALGLTALVSLAFAGEGGAALWPADGPGLVELSAATVLERMHAFHGEWKTPWEDISGKAVAAPGRERWLAPDKAKHLGVSFVASLGLAVWLRDRGMAEADCPGWAGSAVFSLGVFKEVALDRHHPESKASWQDVVANLVGVACAGLVWTWVREP